MVVNDAKRYLDFSGNPNPPVSVILSALVDRVLDPDFALFMLNVLKFSLLFALHVERKKLSKLSQYRLVPMLSTMP